MGNNTVNMKASTLAVIMLATGISGVVGNEIGGSISKYITASAAQDSSAEEPIHMDYSTVPRRSFEDAVQYDLGQDATPSQTTVPQKMNGDTPGAIRPGAPVYSGIAQGGCTMSPPVAVGDAWYAITAGHCVQDGAAGLVKDRVAPFTHELGASGDTYTEGGLDVGYYEVPENLYDKLDPFAVSRDADIENSGWIRMGRSAAAPTPSVGEAVCMAGQTSGWVCGFVTEVDETRMGASLCARGGDSGSPIYTLNGDFVGILNSSIVDGEGNVLCTENGYSSGPNTGTKVYASRADVAVKWLQDEVGARVNNEAMESYVSFGHSSAKQD